jgi:spore germination protein YaaH
MRALLLAAAVMSAPMLASAYTSAWVSPFDAFSSVDWDCFDEIGVFAMAFDAKQEIFTAYPKLLEQSAAAKPARVPLVPVMVNDVWNSTQDDVQTLKSLPVLAHWLGDAKRLDRHVDDLAKAAAPYDGIELDYEHVPDHLWGAYVELIEKLADKLHAQGKILGVDVESGPLYSKGGAVARRHWRRLGAAADKVKIMCYYERGEFSSGVGPGSSTEFVSETGRRALAILPADKISLALSLAATDWQVPLPVLQARRHAARLHFRKARELMIQTGAQPLWDDALGAPYFKYEQDGQKHEVWYEDEKTLGAKIAAARKLGVGVSLWYLGAERPDLRAMGLCGKPSQSHAYQIYEPPDTLD